MRETDPRDCQHGEADATQERIEQLQARIAQLEEACKKAELALEIQVGDYYNEARQAAVVTCRSALSQPPSDYLKQVRKQVRDECALICHAHATDGAMACKLAIRAAKEK